eukprot:symbB.v1.2.038065.t1/scaffold5805.1/size23493/2
MMCLRWNLDKGNAVVFKSLTPSRIQENVDVFDFSLSEDDLQKLDALTTPEVVQEAQGHWEQRRQGTPAPWGEGLRPRREDEVVAPGSSSRSSSSHSDRGRYRSRRRSDSRKRSEQRIHRSRSPRKEKDKSDRKSRICMHWLNGTCTKGSDCQFAHGAHELSAVQAGTWKTVLCNHFQKGTCTRGANCSFAHGEDELRDTYKTVLCKYWETGNCKSGSKCNFAHGEKELVKIEPPKIEVKVEKPPEKGSETTGADEEVPVTKPKPEKVSKVNTKDIPCRYWQNGFCSKGESCPFSHEGEQKEPPQAQNFKTILCKYFAQGNCTRGDSCNFAHGNEELPGGAGAAAAASNGAQEQPAPAFKTVLCKYFELGNCSKGDECTYAHGIEELQTREAGTYKTVLCKFFEAGSCSRGASCTFAHGEEDLLNESCDCTEYRNPCRWPGG